MAAVQPILPDQPDFERLSVLLAEVAWRVSQMLPLAEMPLPLSNFMHDLTTSTFGSELRVCCQSALEATSAVILEAVRTSEERVTAKIDEQYIFKYLIYDRNLISLRSSLLILRLRNSKCPHNAQLRYPAGINTQHFPQNKTELYQMRGKSSNKNLNSSF